MNMRPRLSPNDKADVGSIDSKQISNGLMFLTVVGHYSNLSYLLLCQLCTSQLLAPRLSPFVDLVSHIFSVGPKKQMGRIAARRVVALVQHGKNTWTRTARYLPRKSMRSASPVFTVSIFIGQAVPNPTGFALINVVPKLRERFRGRAFIATPSRGEIPSSSDLKNTTTSLADFGNGSHAALAAAKLGCVDAIRFGRELAATPLTCYFDLSQDVNLLSRFANWLGSFGRRNLSFEPFLFYHGGHERC